MWVVGDKYVMSAEPIKKRSVTIKGKKMIIGGGKQVAVGRQNYYYQYPIMTTEK